MGCDTHGIGMGIKNSGAKREQVFVSVKLGYAGPMGGTSLQTKSLLKHLAIDYADLCMIHLSEIGPGTSGHGQYKQGGDLHALARTTMLRSVVSTLTSTCSVK